VFATDWYYESIYFVSRRDWMHAKSSEPTRFRPGTPVTQGEVIEALYNMVGKPTMLNQYGHTLQGLDAADEWVHANGILPSSGGYSYDSFITRQDAALLIIRTAGIMRVSLRYIRNAPVFADEWETAPIARPAISDLFRAGIINGRTSSTFDPLGAMSRAEFAVIMHRFIEATTR